MVISHTSFVLKRDRLGWGSCPLPHNRRRAAYAAAPAGAAGTDRPLPREAARGRLRPRSPKPETTKGVSSRMSSRGVEQQQEQQGGVQVEQQAGEGGEHRAARGRAAG